MKTRRLTATLAMLVAGQVHGSEDLFVLAAAAASDSTVKWQRESVVSGDFTCQGKREFAVLGTKPKEIVVAVFRPPSKKPVDLMRFSGIARSPQSAVLAIESLDFSIKELEQHVGYLPDGIQPSKTCVGLNLSDQMVDSAHIYWHRKNHRFESWSL